MEKIVKIGVLCQYPFPVGMAPTTRIISYSKGLIQNGAEVEVYSFIWRSDNSLEPIEGIIDGVKYTIPCRYHSKKGKLFHIFVDKRNIFYGTIKRIEQSNKKDPFDCLLISFDVIKYFRFFLPKIRRMGIQMALIADEYPEPIRKLKNKVPLWDILRLKHYHRYFKKRVLMTHALESFYNHTISYRPTFILNSVIDETRFIGINKLPVERKYLCYMGNMQLKKDNVDNIIRAFSLIADDFQDYDLHLYGAPNPDDLDYVKNCIATYNLQDRVFIKGRLDYYKVPQVLVNASVLVTSQPNTKRAEGGFPTKMGEYMMTHVPMLVTDVGEIGQYVKDGVTSFVVEPDNSESYAKKLIYILSNPVIAQKVADNAYEYAITHFTAKEVTKGMISFLRTDSILRSK